jgi:hydrophobic/amphiphilic exporter-1 (mainly G- bacteria), HAE1 family
MPPSPPDQSFQYTLNVSGKLREVEEFAGAAMKIGRSGEITRLRDVARVELGSQTYGQFFDIDNKPAAALAVINRQARMRSRSLGLFAQNSIR